MKAEGAVVGDFEIIRGAVDGKKKYCRIPVRSRVADQMMEDGETELDAEKILSMPHEKAVRIIDAIVADWQYWLKRAGELYVLRQSEELLPEITEGTAARIEEILGEAKKE